MLHEQAAPAGETPDTRDLVAEANHRIANSLSGIGALLRHRAARIDRDGPALAPGEVRLILVEAISRLESVARLHRLLSASPGDAPVDIGAYLQKVASDVVDSLAGDSRTRLHFVAELGCRTPADRALLLGQVLVELLTNSIKYAHPTGVPGQIDVTCRRLPGSIVVEVADDGVGMPENFAAKGGQHSGLRLIEAMLRRVNGSIQLHSEGIGLRCEVAVPTIAAI